MAIKNKIKSALIYPVAVLVVAFVVLSIIMIFVIPAFEDVFKSFGADLPAPTLVVTAMSKFFVSYWWAIFGVIGGGGYFFMQAWALGEDAEGHGPADICASRSSAIWSTSRRSRAGRTLSTMFAAGVPLVEALDSVGGVRQRSSPRPPRRSS